MSSSDSSSVSQEIILVLADAIWLRSVLEPALSSLPLAWRPVRSLDELAGLLAGYQPASFRRMMTVPYPAPSDASEADHDSSTPDNPQLHPNCVLLDSAIAGRNGLEVLQALVPFSVVPPAVILADDPDAEAAVQFMQQGAIGVLSKNSHPSSITAAIEHCLQRTTGQWPLVTEQRRVWQMVQELEPFERVLVFGAIQGISNKSLATALGVSERTLERRRAAVLRHFQVESSAQLAWLIGQAWARFSNGPFRWAVPHPWSDPAVSGYRPEPIVLSSFSEAERL